VAISPVLLGVGKLTKTTSIPSTEATEPTALSTLSRELNSRREG
jgi:hypothetical protein